MALAVITLKAWLNTCLRFILTDLLNPATSKRGLGAAGREHFMPRSRRQSSSNILLFLVLLVVALVGLGAAYVAVFVDPNGFKPRLVEAVRAATGRDMALRGPLSLRLAMQPTLRAVDVGLSNPAGASRLEIATLAAVEAKIALWPLLRGRVEVISLVLSQPDILLEANEAGVGNWKMGAPAVVVPAMPNAGEAVASGAAPPRLRVDEVRVEGGKVALRSASGTRSMGIGTLRAAALEGAGPISVVGDVIVEGRDVAVSAELGSLALLLGESSGRWPAQIVARLGGARLSVSGDIATPLEGRGYHFGVEASMPDLAPFAKALGVALPSVQDVVIAARLDDAAGSARLSGLSLRTGTAALATLLPGLGFDRIELAAQGLDQPMRLNAEGTLSGARLAITGTLGPAATLLSDAQPTAVDLQAVVGAAAGAVKGSILHPFTLTGLDLGVALRAPDMAALGRLVGMDLPKLPDLAVDARLSDVPGGVALRNLVASAPLGDVAGEITIAIRPRLAVRGALAGKKLDLDALRALVVAAVEGPVAPFPPGSATAPLPVAGPPTRVLSEEALKVFAPGRVDADLRLGIAEIRSGSAIYRDFAGHVLVSEGRIALDPVLVTSPGGRMEARIVADISGAEPSVAIALNAPGLALKPVLQALGLQADVTGALEMVADVTASGRSAHALASTLSGRIGLVITDGDLDNQLLGRSVGEIMRTARLPVDVLAVAGGGRTRVRCFATRLDVVKGAATVQSMVLDTSRALLTATGMLHLGDETLALRARPMLRASGPTIVVPVRIGGTFLAPGFALDTGGVLGFLPGERGGDACAPAISQARAARPRL
jgi:AsmA protein